MHTTTIETSGGEKDIKVGESGQGKGDSGRRAKGDKVSRSKKSSEVRKQGVMSGKI